ncbi:hypothetical protein H5T52_03880 [Candidatus Bipolaricaulota bacterium]|nr:hypothetical protein [Candidatus Bipolaricaulota bacterium]
MAKTRVPRHIVWSKRELDLSDPWLRRWYIRQVLVHGRAEDVARLDWDEIRRVLPELDLPGEVRRLWEGYFRARA